MLLDIAIIKYQLSKEFDCDYKISSHDLTFDYPILFDGTSRLHGHIVVMGNDSPIQIVQRYEDIIFVCKTDTESYISNSNNNIIIINSPVPISKVYNSILNIFVLFNQWEMKMETTMNGFSSFSELIDNCNCIVEDPIALMDAQFRYVAYSKALAARQGLESKFVDDNYSLPFDFAQQLMTMPNFKKLEKIKEVFDYVGAEHYLHKNIFFKNEYVGRLAIPYSSEESKNMY